MPAIRTGGRANGLGQERQLQCVSNGVTSFFCTKPSMCHTRVHTSHYNDVTMDAIASQITCLAIVYSTVYSSGDQRKHQSYASLAFVWGIHRGPVNSPHTWSGTRKMFPFDDVIMHWRPYSHQARTVLPSRASGKSPQHSSTHRAKPWQGSQTNCFYCSLNGLSDRWIVSPVA